MNILAIISRDLEKGSTKYRLSQYLEFLRNKWIEIQFIKRDDLDGAAIKEVRRFDLVFNQKCLFRYSLAKKMIANSRRVIFDFDDAIYTRPGKPHSIITNYRVKKRLHLWLKNSDLVTTSNNFLAKYAKKHSSAVKIVPMSLNTDLWKPREATKKKRITIGWAGAPVNIHLIESLDPVLTPLLEKFPFVNMSVFSGQKPNLSCPFEYHPFRPGHEPAFVQNLDIGLLPLINDEYSKGKSPIKAIQYLACAIPVVGNIVGTTGEILNDKNSIAVSTEKEWQQALETLINNRELARNMGLAGRRHAVKNHDFKSVSAQFLKILTGK